MAFFISESSQGEYVMKKILSGNEAIARGIVEAGCAVATAYPGTPSSEILPAVAAYADELGTKTAVEWGINEKVDPEIWNSIVKKMIGKISAGKLSDAIIDAVRESGDILAEKIERRQNDRNELDNSPQELESGS